MRLRRVPHGGNVTSETVAERLFVPTDPYFGDTPAPATISEGVAEARAIFDDAMGNWGKIHGSFLMLSGGNDSMVLLDVVGPWAGEIVHINTGIGIPDTTDFVHQTVADLGRPLVELHPPITYEELVLGRWQGLPGPGAHGFTFTMLKERCVRQLLRDRRSRRGQRFLLLTGARQAESIRRMGHVEPVRRVGGQVWVNPIARWSNELMREYREAKNLPVNEVTRHLHMSGECLCGAFASPGEKELIRLFYPTFAARLDDLEAAAVAAGLPYTKWGEKRPSGTSFTGPLCSSCEYRQMSLTDLGGDQ